ncbi:poly-beta-hydroxybutyrate polymerase [Salipiger aestuarii]|uniref:Polyhydroxyalkanoate synthase n=1 Tax=Salipiger aestuarii TaxID=568098 RepID=A0A327YP24_9RHOB|nr:alpha/beta fold hydrolase [Salipiger aestuarii]KAA8610483.1 poly-beta-hydroxybutyrate polymerase [Salipiger aestuarii]KAA8616497.1 poly-beta-hydroxybutyrate polymerase [Salipiger aestuarii]KAB2543425.1 poly-beta-hydroxybutyrate polymerase [Salipiger aestuarii]RAK22017.1 polyhydroxyalkanoate synthase [Salipiger aestuarii]
MKHAEPVISPDPVVPSGTARHSAIDRAFHAAIGSLTGGLSPMALATAWFDWGIHLSGSPAKLATLHEKAVANGARAWQAAVICPLAAQVDACPPMSADKRFRDPEWRRYPYNMFAQWFLLTEDWWNAATTDLPGVAARHAHMTNFAARQALDMLAPSNYAATNPVVLDRTRHERGQNLVRGFHNWLEDIARQNDRPHPGSGFEVGTTLATAPGEVVFRNRLIELIRYRPTTARVQAEPLLIVPAWIMKYYILDLSAQNSLVRFLVDQGIEVWMISWLNPQAEDADLGMEDYVTLGVFAALDVIAAAVPGQRIHTAGYCLGGTLLSIAAAKLARENDARIASVTLLAAQVDFTEAGEITLFIDESQVAFLEDIMADQGYLDAEQMAGAFQMLRSNDLIWSRTIREYLLGVRGTMNDLMAWNADATRMPARMHSEYLRQLFLENRLALGRVKVGGTPVSVADISVPIFAVGTEKDHVAPWPSVWKINRLANGDKTFVLTSGGHNAGIVSEPGHPRRHYRIGKVTGHARDAALWRAGLAPVDGSWWPAWTDWLIARSSGTRPAVADAGTSLCPAPGTYVFG